MVSLTPHRLLSVVFSLLAFLSLTWAQTTQLPAPTLAGPMMAQPVHVSWNVVQNADHYELQVSTTPDFSALVFTNDAIAALTYTLPSSLTAGTAHYWRVRAVSVTAEAGVWSPTWAFTTEAINIPPSAPTLTAPSNGAVDASLTPTLNWTPVTGATSYLVQVDTENTFSYPLTYASTVTNNTITLAALDAGTQFYWRVQGVNIAGNGPWSSISNFTTLDPNQALTPPTLVAPTNNAVNVGRPIQLSWSSIPGATRYSVAISDTSSFGIIQFSIDNISDTSLSVSGLAANKKYFWHVRAVNDYDVSNWSVYWTFTTAQALARPLAPSLVSPVNGAAKVPRPVRLIWNTSQNTDRYEVQISPYGYFPSVIYDNNTITGTQVDVTGLAAYKTYFWRVRAINAVGTSNTWSAIFQFTTATDSVYPPVDAPKLLSPTHCASDVSLTPTLTWGSVTNATSYILQFSTSNTFSAAPQTSYTTTYARLPKLLANTQYYWRVRAYNAGGYGPWSSVNSFTTASVPGAPMPTAPVTDSADLVQPITLSWLAPASTRPLTYTIDVANNVDFANPIVHQEGIATTSFQLPVLPTDTTYYWRVKAVSDAGSGEWSIVWNFMTGVTQPRPLGLQAVFNQATGKMTVSWNSLAGWTTYDIQIDKGDGQGWQSLVMGFTGTSYVYMPPTGTYTYGYRVRGDNGVNVTAFSVPAVVSFELLNLCLDGSYDTTSRQIMLGWNEVPGANWYEIQYRVTGATAETPWTSLATQNAPTTTWAKPLSQMPTIYFAPFNLSNDFRVRSFSMITGESNWSNAVSIAVQEWQLAP